MKAIFLDIDGVLNNQNHIIQLHKQLLGEAQYLQLLKDLGEIPFDYRSCKLLQELIKETDAKVILSSTWRISYRLIKGIEKYAGIEITDITPRLNDIRGKEIQQYLNEHNEIINYVILDDDSDMLDSQQEHFVRVNPKVGFTIKEKINCRSILLKGEENG